MAVAYQRTPRTVFPNGVSESTMASYREREFLSELLIDVSPLEIPFTKLIGKADEAAENMKLEWQQDKHLPRTTTLAADMSAGPSTGATSLINLSVASGTGPYFQKNHVVRIRRVSGGVEQYVHGWVRDDPVGDLVPIVLNYDKMANTDAAWMSSACASADTTHEVRIIGQAINDGQDSPRKSTTRWDQLYNYVQIWDRSFSVGHAQQQMRQYGVKPGGEYNREKLKTFEECYLELEEALIRGVRVAPDTTNDYPAWMGGLQYYVTSNVTSMAGSSITELAINDTLQAIYDSVGSKNMKKMTLIANSPLKRQISRLFSHASGNNFQYQLKQESRTAGVVVNVIDTEFGEVDVLLHKHCPKDRLYFLDISKIKLVTLKNSDWFHEDLSPQGAYQKGHIYGAFSMMVQAPECHGALINCSTTVS